MLNEKRLAEIQSWTRDKIEWYLDGQTDTPNYLAEAIQDLLNEREDLIEQRDLAIAHDRQPYPTAEAYELACKARDKYQKESEGAKACAMSWALDCKELENILKDARIELKKIYHVNFELLSQISELKREIEANKIRRLEERERS